MSTPQCILAPNASAMTLTGTNTWLLRGAAGTVVVDPGPDSATHLDAITAAAGHIAEIWVTHRHHDHTDAVASLAERAGGVAVRAWENRWCRAAEPFHDGEHIDLGPDTMVRVLHLPGHTDDSVGFLHIADGTARLLTGDTVLGSGTTVIVPPHGDLGSYFASLDVMEDVCLTADVVALLPGHGPVCHMPVELVRYYRQHRRERLEQVRAAVAAGHTSAEAVVAVVYGDAPAEVQFAARCSAQAQLDYLRTPEQSTT